MKMEWTLKSWNEVTKEEMYDWLELRSEIFIVEQDCPYQDLDRKDQECYHLWSRNAEGKMIAYSRIVPPGVSYDIPSIGRVVASELVRGTGMGVVLMKESMKACHELFGDLPVKISAQQYLVKFYGKFGFVPEGPGYLEDNLPHIAMTSKTGQDLGPIQAQLNQLNTNRSRFLQTLSEWTGEDRTRASRQSKWNAMQVAEHILTSEFGTLNYLIKKTQSGFDELMRVTDENRGNSRELNDKLRSDNRWKAPDVLPDPEGKMPLSELHEKWMKTGKGIDQFTLSFPSEHTDKLVFRHPFYGRFTLLQTLQFLSEHIVHHEHQLKRIQLS
ncbi:MAG: GNAT family N-acetyltransferase [Flavobacteriales bacterium]|nr:GNAT family N-acetyltransferase [Flavobacteriales bacterium]